MKKWRDENDQALAGPLGGRLCLYVAGTNQRAELAEANVRRCCDAHFAGHYQLEVVDVALHPEVARREQLLALPVLVRQYPTPKRYLVGTLSDETSLRNSLALGTDY